MLDKLYSLRLTRNTCFFIILIIGVLVYFNILFNNFVWLDGPYIINNPIIKNVDLPKVVQGSAFTGYGFYRPITAIYFFFVYSVFGNPVIFHIFQLTIRLVNAFLIFLIFRNFFKKSYSIPLFLSIVNLIHPLNETNTAFISATSDSLFMFFGLSALLLTIKNIQRRKIFISIPIFILILLSLFAKESGFLFFFATFLYILIFLRKEIKHFLLGSIITVCVYTIIRFLLKGFVSSPVLPSPIGLMSLDQRILSIPQIFFFYIQKFFLPFSIGVNHLWVINKINFSDFYFPLLIDLIFFFVTIGLGVFIFKKRKEWFFIFLFFFLIFWVGIFAYSQIIPLDYTVSSRWFNFPMLGLLGMFGIAMQFVNLNKKALFIGLVIIVGLSLRTIDRNTYWQSNISVFTHAAEIKNNFSTERFLSQAYLSEGDYKNALIHMDKSIKLSPYDETYVEKALMLISLDKQKEADVAFEKALVTKSIADGKRDDFTSIELGKYLLRKNKFIEAEKLISKGLMLYKNNARLWILYSYAQYGLGNKNDAIIAIQRAAQLKSENDPIIVDMYTRIALDQPLDHEFIIAQ